MTYLESEAVTAAKKKTRQHESQRPVYSPRWEQELSDTMAKLNSREFSYDHTTDPLWQSYRRAYTRKGQLAMEDTLGKTTALTGGYGNSWAATASQQSYLDYMQALTDKIPELYTLAQQRYDKQTQELNTRYEQYLQRQEADRADFSDSFDSWLQELKLLQDKEQALSQQDYDRYWDAEQAEKEESRYQAEQARKDAETEKEESRYQAEQARKDMEFRTEQDWLNKKWEAEHPVQSSSGSSTGSSTGSSSGSSTGSSTGSKNYDNGNVSTSNIKKMQKALGVTVDGKWGRESFLAAGSVSADVAWANYCSEYGG